MPRIYRSLFPGALLVLVSAITLACGIAQLPGCAVNPISGAEDSEQRAYAIYGTFVIVEEQAATLVGSPQVSNSVVSAIRLADSHAKPSADALVQAVRDYDAASHALKVGSGTASQLGIASTNLQRWVGQARTDVTALVNAVKQGS